MHRRKGARRNAASQTWQRARGPGDARPTPRVLSRGSLGDPRDRDLTIPTSGHAGERRSGFRHPASCPQSAACRARALLQILSARACVERLSPRCTMHMRGSCSARMYCSGRSGRVRRVRKGSGQDLQLALVPEVSRARQTIIPGCTVTYACVSRIVCSNMPADTAPATRPRQPSHLTATCARSHSSAISRREVPEGLSRLPRVFERPGPEMVHGMPRGIPVAPAYPSLHVCVSCTPVSI